MAVPGNRPAKILLVFARLGCDSLGSGADYTRRKIIENGLHLYDGRESGMPQLNTEALVERGRPSASAAMWILVVGPPWKRPEPGTPS